MTTGAFIVLEVFILLVVVFGVYAGYHREDDTPKGTKHKHT
jgi:hypothetical protein